MKKTLVKFTSIAMGGSLLLQSCDGYVTYLSAEEINQIQDKEGNNVAIPLDLGFDADASQRLSVIAKVARDVVTDSLRARQFRSNPSHYCHEMGYGDLPIGLDDGLIVLLSGLGDDELREAIATGDAKDYVKLCKQKGLLDISKLRNSQFIKAIADNAEKIPMKNDSPFNTTRTVTPEVQSSLVYGAISVVIVAVAVEAVVVIGTTTWVTHVNGYEASNGQSNETTVEIWDLTTKGENTYIVATELQNQLADEAVEIVKENYPDAYSGVDEATLRNLILVNIQNNVQ